MLHTYARELLGVPYKHQGRSKTGMDCVGVLVYCAARAGLRHKVHDLPMYSTRPNIKEMDDALSKCDFESIPLAEIKPGDILRVSFGGLPSHFAIYTENGTVIHAVSSRGKVCEHRYDSHFKSQTVAAFRINP